MIRILNCVAYEHNPLFLSLAVITLVVGSVITMRLFARVRRTEGAIRRLWLFLTGLIGGGTIWSTHFVSMLSYESSLIIGYEPILTTVSLLIAVTTTTLGFYVASLSERNFLVELGGLTIGVGISVMHYVGMSALIVSGEFEWNWNFVFASIVLGAIFGALATSRIARPITRFCKFGGAAAFIIAVASMHFTSMSGLSIQPVLLDISTERLISDEVLGVAIFIVMSLLFLTTFITSQIDLRNVEQTSEHYKHLAMHDPLTGIANRLGSEEQLRLVINDRHDDTASVAVLAIDLNRFKDINDAHGHAAGDHLLRTIAERMTQCMKKGEAIGRIGGDEFIAIKNSVFMKRDIKDFAERLLTAIDQPVHWEGMVFDVGASIGFATYPRDSKDPIELMGKADLAMYTAKAKNEEGAVAYTSEMEQANRDRITLSKELSEAISKNELSVRYQLQNDTNTREVCGVEALLRWSHPERELISPGIFIPLAEETGLINELGEWVLRRACTDAADWQMPINVAVNVAAKQLTDPNFPDLVSKVLSETKLPPSRLELEITESGIIADMAQAQHIIKRLKEIGVKVAMDDYGTGYSSLATLQSFPFDKIKIDREFIKALDTNRHSRAIVQSTLILGQSLDIPVLAEGVETENHLRILSELNCEQVQGFLFGKPMSNADLKSFLMINYQCQNGVSVDDQSMQLQQAS